MDRDDKGSGYSPASGSSKEASEQELKQLYNYPSLWRLFESDDPGALAEMRSRLTRSKQELAQLIRYGSMEEAARAERAARAYEQTLALLDELENMREGTHR